MSDELDYTEQGYDLFKINPDLLLAAVWWEADMRSKRLEDQFNFVAGYSAARKRRDDYERERRDHQTKSSPPAD